MPKPFQNTRNKIQKLGKNLDRDSVTIDRMNYREIINEPINFLKIPQEIILLEQEEITQINIVDTLFVEQTFYNMPEWAISQFKLVPIFYSDGSNIINPYSSFPLLPNEHYFTWIVLTPGWKKVNTNTQYNNYIYRVGIRGSLLDRNFGSLRLYLDLKLVFINQREYQTIS
ncbi:MAG: hypothetical protein PVG65_00215 [Candidatus Thorarchaeota archaeon]|jgi:hypothetical protein